MITNVILCFIAYGIAFFVGSERAKSFNKDAWEKGVADGQAAAVKEIVKE